MPPAITDEHVRLLRLRVNQLLDSNPEAGAPDVVNAIVGIQAQDQQAAAFAVRARTVGLTIGDVARARNEERSIVRTWAMRGTLHWLRAADVRWLLELFGADFIRKNRRRREQLGLDDRTCAHAVRLLRDVLANGAELTRAELTEALASRGVTLVGQARPHLLYVAALEGVICCGADRAAEQTYALLDGRVPDGPRLPRDDALAELARRYLAAFGPATAADFAAWSGLPMPDAGQGWQQITDELAKVETQWGAMWTLKEVTSSNVARPGRDGAVRLLGGFDVYLLGYHDRELVVPRQHAKRVNAGGGIIRPIVLVDGLAAGTWRTKRQRHQLEIIVEPFEKLAASLVEAIEGETADVGRFLGLDSTLVIGSALA